MADDVESQRIEGFMKQIQTSIAKKSLKGARVLLESDYSKILLSEQNRRWLLTQIEQAQAKAQKSFKERIYWEWWIIFLITAVVAGVVIHKFGIVGKLISYFQITALAARAVIRGAVYAMTTLIGGAFGYLANGIDKFCTYIFGG